MKRIFRCGTGYLTIDQNSHNIVEDESRSLIFLLPEPEQALSRPRDEVKKAIHESGI